MYIVMYNLQEQNLTYKKVCKLMMEDYDRKTCINVIETDSL